VEVNKCDKERGNKYKVRQNLEAEKRSESGEVSVMCLELFSLSLLKGGETVAGLGGQVL
jgi:hypothetical protein